MRNQTSSTNLGNLQKWLRWVITEPRGVDEALALNDSSPLLSQIRGSEPKPRLLSLINDTPLISTSTRLSIYSNAYFVRLFEVMSTDFPAIRRILGEVRFRRVVADYLLEHPSVSPHVEQLGEQFAGFLTTAAIINEYPFLADLAKLEWTALVVLFSDRVAAIDFSEIDIESQTNWSLVTFELDPTVFIQSSRYPVHHLWLDQSEIESVSPSAGLYRWILYRDDEWVQIKQISEAEAVVLEAIKEQKNLQDICDLLENKFPSQGNSHSIDRWLFEWIKAGVIKKINLSKAQVF